MSEGTQHKNTAMEKLNTYRVTYLETREYFMDVNASDEEHAYEIAETLIHTGIAVDLEENETGSNGYEYHSCEVIEHDPEAISIKISNL